MNSAPLYQHLKCPEFGSVNLPDKEDNTPHCESYKNPLVSRQTVTILNFDDHNNNFQHSNPINFPCSNVDIDFIDDTSPLNDQDLVQYQWNLGLSYNTNKNVLINTHFNNSFSSLNSSLENLSTPPHSRSITPINFNLKKQKLNNLKNQVSNLRFNLGSNYSFNFSPFTKERLTLIRSLASKENIPNHFIDTIFSLLSLSNLNLKLDILKKIHTTSIEFTGNSLLLENWCINVNLNSTAHNGVQVYKQILNDFTILLSLLKSVSKFIEQQERIDSHDNIESIVLLNYYNTASTEKLSTLNNFCITQPIDPDLLDTCVYLFWRTEDHTVCTNFRNLFN